MYGHGFGKMGHGNKLERSQDKKLLAVNCMQEKVVMKKEFMWMDEIDTNSIEIS